MLGLLCCWLFRNVLDAVEMVKGAASGIYLMNIIRFLLFECISDGCQLPCGG